MGPSKKLLTIVGNVDFWICIVRIVRISSYSISIMKTHTQNKRIFHCPTHHSLEKILDLVMDLFPDPDIPTSWIATSSNFAILILTSFFNRLNQADSLLWIQDVGIGCWIWKNILPCSLRLWFETNQTKVLSIFH